MSAVSNASSLQAALLIRLSRGKVILQFRYRRQALCILLNGSTQPSKIANGHNLLDDLLTEARCHGKLLLEQLHYCFLLLDRLLFVDEHLEVSHVNASAVERGPSLNGGEDHGKHLCSKERIGLASGVAQLPQCSHPLLVRRGPCAKELVVLVPCCSSATLRAIESIVWVGALAAYNTRQPLQCTGACSCYCLAGTGWFRLWQRTSPL